MKADHVIAVVIPALNEEPAIPHVLDSMPEWIDQIVVVDNGSTDGTAAVAREHGATVVHEPRRGYGAACLRGLNAVGTPAVVVFVDADNSDDLNEMDKLVQPIIDGTADLVIGSRALGPVEPGALTWPQRIGNAIASALIRRIWKQACTDLGPFRAVRFDALRLLEMDDMGFGWTVQMQARAFSRGLRVTEVPVSYRRRIGQSKISGTVRGVIGAGARILTTIAKESLRSGAETMPRRRLLLFTRYPEAGTAKTRMIPLLGPEGAANLQRDMTSLMVSVLKQWRRFSSDSFAVYFHGGSLRAMQEMFGAGVSYVPQSEGSLGDRVCQAFTKAAAEGYKKIVVIGADCPSIDEDVLNRAFSALDSCDVVVGPATDGGYYLIGTNRCYPELFQRISWGTSDVLAQTRKSIERLGLRAHYLDALSDVDVPADLAIWEQARGEFIEGVPPAPRLSIIIPALNEADHLPETLASIGRASGVEVIVVDGGSSDSTRAIAEAAGAVVISAEPGRAAQMNAGVEHARGETLLFLHADSRLPFGYLEQIESCLHARNALAGAFRLAVDDTRLSLRLIEMGANWRSRRLGLPFGDQAFFLRRQTYHETGGFRDLPIMEDYDLVQRLRRTETISIASTSVITSARRWLEHGVWRTTWIHLRIALGWRLGISPARLAQWRVIRAKGARQP